MRTVKQLPAGTPIESNLAKFPDSTVINETNTAPGTPIVREIYGDILTNIYKILRSAGIVATGIEDNEDNGYQLLDALRKFTNEQNDVEQILNLTGTVFSIPLDFGILPDKYFCFVRAAETYIATTTYIIKGNGTGGQEYGFTCADGFIAGDVLLVVLDHAGARAYNIAVNAGAVGSTTELFTPFGTPLAYSDDPVKIWYQSEGILFTDQPEAYDLQAAIRTLAGDGTIVVYEMFLIGSFILCLSYNPTTQAYRFYKFSLTALATPISVTIAGGSFPTGVDRKPNVYTDGTTIAITNNTGNSANDYLIDLYAIDIAAGTLTASGSISLDTGFRKTTNAVMANNKLYTFIGGVLVQYSLATGVSTNGPSFPTFIGLIFKVKQNVWYSNGEVAKKWILQNY